MAKTDLTELISKDFDKIRLDFGIAKIEGGKTYSDVADRQEHYVQELLRKYLHKSSEIVKNRIKNADGDESEQLDAIILSPYHPDLNQQKFISFAMADEVTCGIEIKGNALYSNNIVNALEQVRSVKKLKLNDYNYVKPAEMSSDDLEWNLSMHERIPAGILCSSIGYKKTEALIKRIFKYYSDEGIPTNQWLDFIVSLDGFLLTTYGVGHILSTLNTDYGLNGKTTKTIMTAMNYDQKVLEYFISIIVYINNKYRDGKLYNNKIIDYIDNYSSNILKNNEFNENSFLFFDRIVPLEVNDIEPDEFCKLSEAPDFLLYQRHTGEHHS